MKRNIGLISIALMGFILTSGDCLAKTMVIYNGKPLAESGITVGGWGSGTADESKEKSLPDSSSVKVVTQGLFKGGRFDFANPPQMMTGPPEKNEYLQFTLNFTTVEAGAAGTQIAFPYGAREDVYPTGYEDEETTTVKPKVSRIRLALQDQTGASAEILQPVTTYKADSAGWAKVAAPLAAIKWPVAPEQFRLKRLIFTTDLPDTIYVADIRIATDDTPITASAGEEQQVVAARDVVVFKAVAEGGLSTLLYSWDFDKSDGIQEDATWLVAQHSYNKRGEYDATLTVKDYYGLKTPATATVHVSVGD